MSKGIRISLIAVIALIIVFFIAKFFVAVERIDAGCVGIQVNLVGGVDEKKGVSDVTRVTGWVVYMPLFTAIYEFPTYVQTKNYEPFTVNAKDGSEFTVDPIFSYQVIPSKVPQIFTQYRRPLDEIEDTYLRNVIYDSYRIVANRYPSDSLISNRQEFEVQVQNMLQDSLSKEGFHFKQLTSNMVAPQSLKDAIDSKNKTIQEAQQAENKIRQAEANAKALLIAAEAEKKVNDLKTQSLSPLIIQQKFIEKWDGKLPVYGETPKLFRDITK